MMKVVLTRSHNAFEIGGINTYVWSIACELSRKGFDVHVVSGCGEVDTLDKYWAERFNGQIHVLKRANFASQHEQLLTWLRRGSQLMHQLRPEIVHFNGAIPFLFDDAPSVATCHGILNKRLTLPILLYDKLSYRHFTKAIIAVSEKVRDELYNYIKVSKTKVIVIPIGFDISSFGPIPFEKRENAILCGWGYIKNPEASLKAFHELKKNGINCRLYVAGLSRKQALISMPNLSSLVQDQDIIFTGRLDKYSMIKLYQRVKCGLLPSLYEAFPYGVLELFACGTPVVGSYAIPNHVLRHAYNGFMVLPHDFSAMTKYVSKLFEDDKLWKKMSKNAQQTANLFSISKMTKDLINLYQNLVKSY